MVDKSRTPLFGTRPGNEGKGPRVVGELRLCPELYGLLVAPNVCPSFCWPLAPHRASLLLSCHLALFLHSTLAPSPKALE